MRSKGIRGPRVIAGDRVEIEVRASVLLDHDPEVRRPKPLGRAKGRLRGDEVILAPAPLAGLTTAADVVRAARRARGAREGVRACGRAGRRVPSARIRGAFSLAFTSLAARRPRSTAPAIAGASLIRACPNAPMRTMGLSSTSP